MTGGLSKNFHGVGIGPLSEILAVKCIPNNKQANEFRKSLVPLYTATKDAVLLCPQRKRGWQKLEALHQNYDGGDASFTQ